MNFSPVGQRGAAATAGVLGVAVMVAVLVGIPAPPAAWADDGVPPRARDLGVPFAGTAGPLNAITDVAGVTVGHTTIIRGNNVRTGVTAVFPRGNATDRRVPAGWYTLNGNGEMTGTTWLTESGLLEGPVMLTNTHSVGLVRDAVIAWGQQKFPGTGAYSLPVIAETWDGFLNHINGHYVRPQHVTAVLKDATGGPVVEGNVGGGTGMMAYGFKGGIGTASRRVTMDPASYTVGVLVQANYGRRPQLTIAGVPVGRHLTENLPQQGPKKRGRDGSIVVVVATDAPLLAHQLTRIARRVPLALGRLGSIGMDSSGDLFIAFSTAVPTTDASADATGLQHWAALPNDAMNPLFLGTIQAVEEAVVNALVAARTMTGRDGNTVHGLPHGDLREVLKKYGRLDGP